jgi:hypothetical protein
MTNYVTFVSKQDKILITSAILKVFLERCLFNGVFDRSA